MRDSLIPLLNHHALDAMIAGLWASVEVTVMVLALGVVDWALRDRVRAALRYGLWMLLVVKLLLPPGLLSPTSIAYWVAPHFSAAPKPLSAPQWTAKVSDAAFEVPAAVHQISAVPPRALTGAAALFLIWVAGSTLLAIWMLRGQAKVTRRVRAAENAPARLLLLLRSAASELGMKGVPALRLGSAPHSPAVCGLWRPVILLPAGLDLSDAAWRVVFLHELTHLRRRDLWANLLQVLTQLVWWWNPLVWWGNAHIRHLRELAVDEAVMLANQPEGGEYPATLVAMARHCLVPPALMLNFLGILESPSRLELRVRRLLEKPLPRTAQLGWAGWVILGTVAATAVPMGFRQPDPFIAVRGETVLAPPSSREEPTPARTALGGDDPRAEGLPEIDVRKQALVTRTYRLDSRVILAVLGGNATAPIAAGKDVVQHQLHAFLAANGLEFPQVVPGQTPDQNLSAAFLNPTNGSLYVRASREQQDQIERLLQQLNARPQQITIVTRVVEGDLGAIARLTLPWLPDTSPPEATKSSRVARLTEAEGGDLVDQLENTTGIEILTTPKVTTLSGRSAQIGVTDQRTIVTGESNTPAGTVHFTTTLSVGPTVDVTARTDSGRTNVLLVTAAGRVVDFLGYEEAKTPTPLIRTNEAHGEARLWDGDMLVLQLPPITNTVRMIDRVPVLGDIPLVGRLFRNESTGSIVRQRLVLISPVLIDPAGQRLNHPKRLPFDPSTPP